MRKLFFVAAFLLAPISACAPNATSPTGAAVYDPSAILTKAQAVVTAGQFVIQLAAISGKVPASVTVDATTALTDVQIAIANAGAVGPIGSSVSDKLGAGYRALLALGSTIESADPKLMDKVMLAEAGLKAAASLYNSAAPGYGAPVVQI